MLRIVVSALAALMLAGCGAASPASPSAAPTSTAQASSAPSAAVTAASPSAAVTAASPTIAAGSAHRLFDCHPSGGASTGCPMAPGSYVADIHDRFSLEVKDTGWQEGATLPEDLQDEEPTLRLNRVADPNQRLIIDTGPTGPKLSDTQLLPDLTGLQVSPPMPVTIGGLTGYQVDLAPSKSVQLRLPVVPKTQYQLEPGHTYRLTVAQLPMDQESGIKLILVSAPTAAWTAFAPLADALVQTLRFQ